jgi:hypothetical protein
LPDKKDYFDRVDYEFFTMLTKLGYIKY